MGGTVRKQVDIELTEDELLRQRARELGISEADLIREAIARVLHNPAAWRSGFTTWEEVKAEIEERRRMETAQKARGWTRDELYEERFERLSLILISWSMATTCVTLSNRHERLTS